MRKVITGVPTQSMPFVDRQGSVTLPWFAWITRGVQGSYVPVVTASGGMTVNSLVVNLAQYRTIDNACSLIVDISFTTGGTADAAILISMPVPALDGSEVLPAALTDGSGVMGFCEALLTGFSVKRYDGSNWGIGAGRRIKFSGTYYI